MVLALTSSSALAATVTVSNNGDSGTGSLRAAIGSSSPGDTINFSSTLSGQTITLTSGELAITHSLTITGLGASTLTVSGDNASRVFDVDAPGGAVAISGLTITGGAAPAGGGATNGDGGGILIRAGTFNLSNATVTTNKTTGTGSATNTCSGPCGSGGGISNDSTSTTTLASVTVSGNTTDPTESCGGVGSESTGALVVVNSAVTGNSSGDGGGACTEAGGNLSITGTTIGGNTAQGAVVGGNAIYAEGGGVDEAGGGTTTITTSTISQNTANGIGGGISEDGGGTIDVTSSTISTNHAPAVVGGTCVQRGPSYPIPCGAGTSGAGGGIGQDGGGTVTVSGSALVGNTTDIQGGALHVFTGTSTINDSTVYDNVASGDGGGVFTGDGGMATVNLNEDTIDANNSSDLHACCSTHININDTIIARGTPDDCSAGSGTITSEGHNLADDATCALTGTGDRQGVAPLLGSPQGTPEYLPELAGSPTIDTGDPAADCLPTDQRGLPRPDNHESVCDIGAFEFQDAVVRPVAPHNTGLPVISGTARAGRVLLCSTGSWSGSPSRFAFVWSRDGTPLVGATGSSYRVQALDEGSVLTCTVTASNSGGSASATSRGVRVAVPRVRGCPAASGSLHGTTLGLLHLGMTRAQARRVYRHVSTRHTVAEDFFCLLPMGIGAGYPSPRLLRELRAAGRFRGRVVWLNTANPIYAVDGIRPGATLAAARARLPGGRTYVIGLNTWYVAPAGPATAELKLRGGVVQVVGISIRQLTTGKKALTEFLNSFG